MSNIIYIAIIILLSQIPAMSYAQLLVDKQIIIFKESGIYACFPELFKESDGTLVVSFSARNLPSHYSTGGARNIVMVSKDNGTTWQLSTSSHLNPAFRDNALSYSYPFSKGWEKVDASQVGTLKSHGVEIHEDRGNYYYAQNIYVRHIGNNGQDWTEQLNLPKLSLAMTYNISSFLRMKSGVKMRMFYGKFPGTNLYQPFLLRSTNEGSSWTFASKVPVVGATGFNEAALTELDDGRVIAIFRPDPAPDQQLYMSLSSDTGFTWSKPVKLGVTGIPANAITDSGRLIISYGYRITPMGVRVQVFDSKTVKPMYPELILRKDSDPNKPSDVGYPMTVSLGNNEFFTVYYITTDNVTHIAGTRWKIASEATTK